MIRGHSFCNILCTHSHSNPATRVGIKGVSELLLTADTHEIRDPNLNGRGHVHLSENQADCQLCHPGKTSLKVPLCA